MKCPTKASPRRGVIMPLVLIAMATLTLAVSIYAEQMLAEYRATQAMAGHLPAAAAAQSGLAYIQSHIRSHSSSQSASFQWHDLSESREAGFWVVAQRLRVNGDIEYGLVNESGKLNLNGLALDLANADASRNRLLRLPGMTPQIADAILDWIDADDSPRASGAERNWYTAARASKLPTQRPLKELSELLNVRGVTPALLYGEDQNGNGWLDDCENDGSITSPIDNADGQLDRGWSEYLTVVGAESNYRDSQRMKIYLNDSNLVNLYDQLLPELGPQATTFIVALRLEGPKQQGDVERESEKDQQDERLRSANKRLIDQLDRTSTSGTARRVQTRGGLDLSAQPTFVIQSMADLINCEVLTMINSQQELLRSPWDLSQIELAMARLEQVCTTQPGPQVTQRINIQYAAEQVLQTIPGLDENKARALANRRLTRQSRASVGWLVRDGLMTLEQLRQTAPYMTMGGDVWSGHSIGCTNNSSALASVHFILDATLPQPRLLRSQESMPFTLPQKERPQS